VVTKSGGVLIFKKKIQQADEFPMMKAFNHISDLFQMGEHFG
jgi:hypothetical protein